MQVIHDEKKHRFYCMVDGFECYAAYTVLGDGSLDFFHTFTPPELRGRGIAKEIFDHVQDHLKKNRLKAHASCSYAADYFAKHGL